MKKFLASAAIALGLAAPATAAPMQWASNGHYYEVIWAHAAITWNQAKNMAAALTHNGQTGYLATITSAAEQTFVDHVNNTFTNSSNSHSGTYVRAWLGGNDIASEGTWEWITGESFSYSNWAGGEPNNYFGEDHLLGWWSGNKWNDCDGTCNGVQKFVVEFDAAPSQVPVPATLPLALGAFGLAGFIARRRKSA